MYRRQKFETMTDEEILQAVQDITGMPVFYGDMANAKGARSRLGQALSLIAFLDDGSGEQLEYISLKVFPDMSAVVEMDYITIENTYIDIGNILEDGPMAICRSFLCLADCIQERKERQAKQTS